jgi:hypothetical protein
MYTAHDSDHLDAFNRLLASIRDITETDNVSGEIIIRSIYTIQQSIGATLDALPGASSNTARKINGDLFERLIQLLICEVGVTCKSGTVKVPVYVQGKEEGKMKYQHDLLLYQGDELKVIGSVKTSSKDRLDKIFLDKFLYSKLTETTLQHNAIFLNDVQRKKTRKDNVYSINSTFLSGHFKAFLVKLNPLDGVYYCDIRPNMQQDVVLRKNIKTIDQFFCSDIWNFLEHAGLSISEVEVKEEQP